MPRTTLKAFTLALFAASALAFWIGFFFPDDYILATVPKARPFLWAARVGVPALVIAAVWMAVRRPVWSALVLLALGTVSGASVLYVAADQVYSSNFRRTLASVHTSLQIDPPVPTPSPTPGRRLRIFCLGGSTTEFKDKTGVGWPERVEARLNARHESRAEVHNLGRHWYTTLHTLVNYEVNLRPHRPDVVLVMHAINDLLHNADFSYFSRGPFREDYGHFHGPLARATRRDSLLVSNFRVLRALWYAPTRAPVDSDVWPGLVPFERNLRTLIELARADGSRVVLLTQPTLLQPSMTAAEERVLQMVHYEAIGPKHRWTVATAARGMTRYNDAVRTLARTEGLPLIDLEAAVPKTLEYFTDEVHYTRRGYERVAEVVAERLQDLVPGPSSGAPGVAQNVDRATAVVSP